MGIPINRVVILGGSFWGGGIFELQSMFPTRFHGHGFLIRDYIRVHTQLQRGPLCPLLSSFGFGVS